jgi:hypothetical protein
MIISKLKFETKTQFKTKNYREYNRKPRKTHASLYQAIHPVYQIECPFKTFGNDGRLNRIDVLAYTSQIIPRSDRNGATIWVYVGCTWVSNVFPG